MLKSIRIGAAIVIACALVVNLTVIPTLLHTCFGNWIVQVAPIPSNLEECFLQRPEDDEYILPTSIWYQLSQHLLHPYKSVIIFLLICQVLVPVPWNATELESSLSFELMMPKASPSLETFHRLEDKLVVGRLSPYQILFDRQNKSIQMDSEEGFDVMHRVLDELAAIDKEGDGMMHISMGMDEFEELFQNLMNSLGFSNSPKLASNDTILCTTELESVAMTTYAGIAVFKNVCIPHSLFVAAQLDPCPIEVNHLINYVGQTATSQDHFATFVTATLAVNPFSDEGVQWLKSAREMVERLEDSGALGGIKINMDYFERSGILEEREKIQKWDTSSTPAFTKVLDIMFEPVL